MTTISRQELKKNFPDLIAMIQRQHVMGPEIEEELFVRHKPVVGLCHTRGYFVIWDGMYIQYTMGHVIVDLKGIIGRSLQEVIIYDSYIEYERARVKAMSKVAPADQTGLNLN